MVLNVPTSIAESVPHPPWLARVPGVVERFGRSPALAVWQPFAAAVAAYGCDAARGEEDKIISRPRRLEIECQT